MTEAQELALSTQLAVGVVFMLAGPRKLVDRERFARQVARYEVIPDRFAPPLAVSVAATETLIAVACLTGIAVIHALHAAVVLVALFGIGLAVNLVRGRRIPCGCFGSDDEIVSGWSLFRLVLVGSGALFALGSAPGMDAGGMLAGGSVLATPPLNLLRAATLAAGLVIVGTWLTRANELRLIAPPTAAPRLGGK